MEEKYLYSINPRRTIKNIAGVNAIRTSKSLFLNKDEVLECLKNASVYRRFSVNQIVKVTPYTLDRLHNEKFMDEKEYEKFVKDSKGKDRGTAKEVIATVDKKEKADEKKSPVMSETSEKPKESPKTVGESEVESVDNYKQNSQDSKPEPETTVDNDTISVSEKVEVKDSVSNQLNDEEVDEKPNFQSSPIQINTGKKKHKH